MSNRKSLSLAEKCESIFALIMGHPSNSYMDRLFLQHGITQVDFTSWVASLDQDAFYILVMRYLPEDVAL